MTRQHWPSTKGSTRGEILLLHGLSSIADSWWQVGPALADDGWDVTAVDQAGHGGRPVDEPVTTRSLAAAIREVVDDPDVLIGHSMGALTALALLEDDPRWAGRVILEEPGSVVDQPGIAQGLADSITMDHTLVQNDRPDLTTSVRAGCPDWDRRCSRPVPRLLLRPPRLRPQRQATYRVGFFMGGGETVRYLATHEADRIAASCSPPPSRRSC